MDKGIAGRYFVSVRGHLQPVICSNISKSEGFILTTFRKLAPASSFKPAKRVSLYHIPSLRQCLANQRLRFLRRCILFIYLHSMDPNIMDRKLCGNGNSQEQQNKSQKLRKYITYISHT
jgi:hypothetical protein